MSPVDWLIVASYVAVAFLIGVIFARRASKGTTDFFIAGRSLQWFVAGTSMVATTYSSDTPIFVAAMVRDQGIYANWLWWSWIIGVMVSAFFFAPLWRRSQCVTEIEFLRRRYLPTKSMATLRVFRALYDGLFFNCVVMASVTLAMSKLLAVVLGLPADHTLGMPMVGPVPTVVLLLAGLGVVAVIYTSLSGLYGVVYTDLIQFALAMIGAIALAVMVHHDLSDSGGFAANLRNAVGEDSHALNFFPAIGANLETATFVILITFGWWIHAPGTGYMVQRTLATRSERDAVLSVYWYAFCHFVLRSWPWIVVGVASLIYIPTLVDSELSYPHMIEHVLPVGLKGVMVASILAAFMSTLDTHMNWGSSYLINDVYKPYLVSHGSDRHYVYAARICMLMITLLAVLLATALTGVLAAVKYLAVMVSGAAFPLIARWYWWRINVWSELSAMISSLIVGNALLFLVPDHVGQDWFAVRLMINTLVGTTVTVVVALATSTSGPSAHVIEFYEKMRIPGGGWETVRRQGRFEKTSFSWKASMVCCIASSALLVSLLLGTGYLIFADWIRFCAMLAVAVVSVMLVFRHLPSVLSQVRRSDQGSDAI